MSEKKDEKLQKAPELVEQQEKQKENIKLAEKEIMEVCDKYGVVLCVQQPQIHIVLRA